MEVLKVRHILDNILSNLQQFWNADDHLNLLIALQLDNEYAHRELNLKHLNHVSKVLLTHNLKFFTPEIIRSKFTIFWDKVDLNKFNEQFFIDNNDLIDHEKLKQLKKKNVTFDYKNLHFGIVPHFAKRNFSELFHQTFPIYNELKICYNYECMSDVEVLGQLCTACKSNQCPRCREVILPQLVLDDRGCCEECVGCSEYDNY